MNNSRKDVLLVVGIIFAMVLMLNFIAERWDQRQFDQCMSIGENK